MDQAQGLREWMARANERERTKMPEHVSIAPWSAETFDDYRAKISRPTVRQLADMTPMLGRLK